MFFSHKSCGGVRVCYLPSSPRETRVHTPAAQPVLSMIALGRLGMLSPWMIMAAFTELFLRARAFVAALSPIILQKTRSMPLSPPGRNSSPIFEMKKMRLRVMKKSKVMHCRVAGWVTVTPRSRSPRPRAALVRVWRRFHSRMADL